MVAAYLDGCARYRICSGMKPNGDMANYVVHSGDASSPTEDDDWIYTNGVYITAYGCAYPISEWVVIHNVAMSGYVSYGYYRGNKKISFEQMHEDCDYDNDQYMVVIHPFRDYGHLNNAMLSPSKYTISGKWDKVICFWSVNGAIVCTRHEDGVLVLP